MCQIFCCSIIQEVSFNYHHRNVRSRVLGLLSSLGPGLELPGLGLDFYDKVSVSKFEPGLGLRGYDLDYITAVAVKYHEYN